MKGGGPPLVVRVHFDFASSLCWVAHRVMQRLAIDLAALGIDLAWTPLDLALLLGIRRGASIPEPRRANAARVARELGVALAAPTHWRDSRAWNAAALLAAEAGCEAAYREAAWSALYDGPAEPSLEAVAAGADLALPGDALAAAVARVATLTGEAREAEVNGVPAFVLGGCPLVGIQSDATMLAMLRRFALRQAADARRS